MCFPDVLRKINTVSAGHLNVGDNYGHIRSLVQNGHGFLRRNRLTDFKSSPVKHVHGIKTYQRLVINYENDIRPVFFLIHRYLARGLLGIDACHLPRFLSERHFSPLSPVN